MTDRARHEYRVEPGGAGQRLDHFLQARLPQFSRSRLQDWIQSGRVLVDGAPATKRSAALRGGELVSVAPAELPPLKATPEEIPLRVIYEDADVVAIDKPAGMVVHAGAGRHSGTLVNALLHRFESLSQLGGDLRPGIVHRLDRDTSGVLLVAKNDAAHQALARQFAAREVEKVYLALVHGAMPADSGRIDKPVARDPVRRTRMTAKLEKGRSALTFWHVLRRFDAFSLLKIRIGTGRTHQIRVHLASLGHPIAGDPLYGAPRNPELTRHFLHAHRIAFTSPATGARIEVESPLAPDLAGYLESLTV